MGDDTVGQDTCMRGEDSNLKSGWVTIRDLAAPTEVKPQNTLVTEADHATFKLSLFPLTHLHNYYDTRHVVHV